MNDNTYSLRRKVIDLIYEIKNSGVSLPRIDVRIGEARKPNLLGVAMLNSQINCDEAYQINKRREENEKWREFH